MKPTALEGGVAVGMGRLYTPADTVRVLVHFHFLVPKTKEDVPSKTAACPI